MSNLLNGAIPITAADIGLILFTFTIFAAIFIVIKEYRRKKNNDKIAIKNDRSNTDQ